MKILPFALSCFALFALHTADAQSTHRPLSQGDRAYDRKQYKNAEKYYRIAADRDNGNPQAVYNLGNTLYQQGKFEDAEQRYGQTTLSTASPTHKADALHNLGDACLKQRKYKAAVQAYEASLRLRPGDPGTRQNLQMARKKLQEEEKQDKAQQQKKQQEAQNQGQDQPSSQSPSDPQEKEQNQSDPGPQDPQPGQSQPTNGAQQKRMEEQRLKKEDARRLLETAVGPDDRKNAQKYRAAQQQTRSKTPKKDW